MRHQLPLAFAAALISATLPAAARAFDASAYHNEQCTRCHDSSVYTREDRRVRSYPALEAQVERCDINLAAKLPPEPLAQLIDYLNTHYYKFAK